MKETLKQAGYRHIKTVVSGMHILQEVEPTIEGFIPYYEIWYANKNHASYGIIYKNTHLEFACSLDEKHAREYGLNYQHATLL